MKGNALEHERERNVMRWWVIEQHQISIIWDVFKRFLFVFFFLKLWFLFVAVSNRHIRKASVQEKKLCTLNVTAFVMKRQKASEHSMYGVALLEYSEFVISRSFLHRT